MGSETRSQDKPSTLRRAVERAHARRQRIVRVEALVQSGLWVVAGAGLVAALRPLIWPLAQTDSLSQVLPRTLLLFGIGLALFALVALFRRRKITPLATARQVDTALGLDDVVASAFAFHSLNEPTDYHQAAMARGEIAIEEFDGQEAFAFPSFRPRARALLKGSVVAATLIALGCFDPALLRVLLSPPTADETQAADELAFTASALAQATREEREQTELSTQTREREERDGSASSSSSQELSERARRAASAVQRGDRRQALRELSALREAGRDSDSRARSLRRALRQLAQSLENESAQTDPSSSGSSRTPSTRSGSRSGSRTAAAQARLLAKQLRRPREEGSSELSPEERRVLERLTRSARLAAEQDGERAESERASEALSRAAAALSRGEREAAAQALTEAAERAERMDEERRGAEASARAVSRLLERAGLLERAVQMAMLGRSSEGRRGGGPPSESGSPRDGSPGDRSLGAALSSRLAALRAAESPGSGQPGHGLEPHVPDRGNASRARLEVHGSLRAPSQVREGERAIQAIRGMGDDGEPTQSYRDVYPSYDARAEDALESERVPASRHATVRRYFEAIRPGSGTRGEP